jgi:DNA-binding MarR family transcriptional regulator
MAKRFGIVDLEVMQDPDLSLRAKGVYALLCTYANKDRICFPSITTLAEVCGVSRRTMERVIHELEQKSYVKREGRDFHLR